MDSEPPCCTNEAVPPQAPGTGGSPNPSPALAWPPLRAACMDLPPKSSPLSRVGDRSVPTRGVAKQRTPYPGAWQPWPPVPTESPRSGPFGRSWPPCCRPCSCSGRATLGARLRRSRASWPRYLILPVTLRRGGSPCGGSPGRFTDVLLGDAPCLRLWTFQVGAPAGAPNAGASAVAVKGAALSTGWAPPDRWAE